MATRNIDTSGWERFKRRVLGRRNPTIRVGILGDAELATIGLHHEYGAPRAGIPERSFIRSTLRERERDLARLLARVERAVLAGRMTPDAALDVIGLFASNAIKAKIRSNIRPALKAATIARKGSSLALVDEGRLINSIRWEIIG